MGTAGSLISWYPDGYRVMDGKTPCEPAPTHIAFCYSVNCQLFPAGRRLAARFFNEMTDKKPGKMLFHGHCISHLHYGLRLKIADIHLGY